MSSSNPPLLSSSPSSVKDLQQWLTRFTTTFGLNLLLDTDFPVCISQLPQTLTSQKPDSYIPQHVGLGPIHHFRSDLYSKQEQLKITTAKTVLKTYKITDDFYTIVKEKNKMFVPAARCRYELYFDIDDECLAWVFAIDALYLLDVLSKSKDERLSESLEDVFMFENQIPLIILLQLLYALDPHDFDRSFLSNLLVEFCETRSPLRFTSPETETQLDFNIYNTFHLLDFMYRLIVNHTLSPRNPFLRTNFLLDVHLEDVENAVQIACANAFLQPVLLVLKLPWDKISVLIKNMFGENPAMLEIDIPSVSKLSRIGKIEFRSTPGGIKDIEFDVEKLTFSLPVLDLKSDSEVILRNLVAYEEFMFKKGNIANLDFTEYVDLMCGIIDGVKDVKILREKKIIEGDLGDEEIVKIFNGISKSSVKIDGKKSELQKTIVKVSNHFGNIPRVKVFNFIKKMFLASWKIIVIVFSVLSLVLTIVAGVCQVYECKGHFGLANVQSVLPYDTRDNAMVDL